MLTFLTSAGYEERTRDTHHSRRQNSTKQAAASSSSNAWIRCEDAVFGGYEHQPKQKRATYCLEANARWTVDAHGLVLTLTVLTSLAYRRTIWTLDARSLGSVLHEPHLLPLPIMADQNDVDLDSIIDRLLEVRGSRPGKQVQLLETEIRYLCTKSREIFISQPILLELEAPIKV